MRHPRAAMAKPVFAPAIGTVQAVSAGSASAGTQRLPSSVLFGGVKVDWT